MNRFQCHILTAFAAVIPAAVASANGEARMTFTKDVAPIFMKSCVICHHPGDIAPMSLLTYEETRPWAKSIRKAVAGKVMPPWDASPAHGKFSNDISLTDEEVGVITAWVDAGAPEGDRSLMPKAPEFAAGWRVGEPDVIIDLGEIKVPAQGADLFINKLYALDLPEDRWVRAVEVHPGNKEVMHHLVTFKGFIEMGSEPIPINDVSKAAASPVDRRDVDILSIWAAGTPPTVNPAGMGHPIKKNSMLTFNIHIHPNGKETTDQTTVGLFFGEGPIEKEIETGFAVNTGILIPAGDKGYTEVASHVFGQDSQIISFFPHMHVRGKAMTYKMTYPDGREETLLDVPTYDFNWQWVYYPEEYIKVPKGSRIEVTAKYDNSAANEHNPDPAREIMFGEDTNSEMLFGFFEVIADEGMKLRPAATEERVKPLLAMHPEDSTYELSVGMGMGKLSWGLYLPKDGEGTVYILDGNLTLTCTTRDIVWDGSTATMKARLIEGAGDTVPLGIQVTVSADGSGIEGRFVFGRYFDGTPVPEAMGLKFTGRLASAPVPAQTD